MVDETMRRIVVLSNQLCTCVKGQTYLCILREKGEITQRQCDVWWEVMMDVQWYMVEELYELVRTTNQVEGPWIAIPK